MYCQDNVAIPCNDILSITILSPCIWWIVTFYVSINTWAYLPIQKRCTCIKFAKSTVLSVSGSTSKVFWQAGLTLFLTFSVSMNLWLPCLTDCLSIIGKEKRVMPFNIRKKKPDVKVAYLTLVRRKPWIMFRVCMKKHNYFEVANVCTET